MDKKENFLTKYFLALLSVFLLAVLIIFSLGKISEKITEKTDSFYFDYYLNEEPGFSSPWYKKGLHRVDESFIYSLKKTDKKTLYAIGSSFTSNNINDETVDLNGYDYKCLVCGNGNYRSSKILYNLGKKADIFKPEDIIKYEVSYSSFRDNNNTITESVVNKWGKYSVNDDLEIKENPKVFDLAYRLNIELIKIQNVWELVCSYFEQQTHKERYPTPRGYGNYKNYYFNYESVADSCFICEEYEKTVLNDIDEINSNYTTTVEISPLQEGLLNTEFGTEVNRFIEEDLIPYLDKKGISYIDYRFDYDDSEFADGVHLSYKSTIKHTEKLNQFINENF